MTTNITLMQDAYACGGNGCAYRLHTDTGAPSIYVLYDWYEAVAEDAESIEYLVIWRLRNDYDDQIGDESDACDWNTPAEVIRLNDGANVTDSVTIKGIE